MSRLAQVFGSGENPLRWAVPLYRAWGISVRVHVLFIVFIVVRLLFSLDQSLAGVGHAGLMLAALFGLVLLHEYGHCFACRRVGGEADEVLLWPLGGLAMCRPPHDWRSNLITTVGGPGVNAVLLLPLGAAVWWLTGEPRAVFFDLFNPGTAFGAAQSSSSAAAWGISAVIALHVMNAYGLLFNVLVPMYPMDGGRILHALLWRQMGYHRATDVATLVGMVAAGVMAVVGIVTEQTMLMAIAFFGAITCWQDRRQLRFASSGGDDAIIAASQRLAAEETKRLAEARRRREAEAARQAEVDRILAKIAKEGMASLTRKEQQTLKDASAKK